MSDTKKSVNRIIGTLSTLMLIILFFFDITNIRSNIIIQILIYWSFGALALFTVVTKIKINSHTLVLLFFSVYIVAITVISQSMNISTIFINFGFMTLWIWIMILFTYANEKNDFNEKLFTIIAIFSIFMGIYIITNYETRKLVDDFGFVNRNYYLLCALPILFLTKKGVIKVLSITIAFLTVFLSLKRTGIISLFLIAFFLILYYFKGHSRFKLKATIAVLLIVVVALNYDNISKLIGVDVLKRFDTLSNDGGSGRFDIYKQCLNNFWNGGAFRMLFGCGYNGFINFYGSEYSSHNDILEVLIDYGVIGLFLYIGIVFRYIKVCIFNIKNTTKYAQACIVSLCSFVCVTLFSHCVIYPQYFMYLILFWTYVERKTIVMNESMLEKID